MNLTLAESLAVLMLAGRLRGTGRLPLAEQAARAAMKIESGLPRGLRDHVGSILDRVHMSIGPTSGHEGLDETFKQLCTAAATRKVCRIEYVSFHEQQQIATEVHPLRLVFVSRAWYVRAFSVMHGEVRTFKLTRIRLLDVAEQTFEPPPGADGDEPFGAAWSMIPEGRLHDVHLRFEEMVAGNVAEVQWHPSQRVTRHDDGTIDFYVTVDGLREISWWILGYGDQVEVVDPPELRERIAEVAARAVEKNSRRAGRS